MNIKEIMETSDGRSQQMYFLNTYLYLENDIVLVRDIDGAGMYLRSVRTGRMLNVLEPKDYGLLRNIEVPNFYYRFHPKKECKHPEYEYIYVYRTPKRTMVKGFSPEKYAARNPFHDINTMVKALDRGDVIFSDKFSANGRMWFQGRQVGVEGRLEDRFEWIGE